jgi:hypothetical protein
MNFKSKLATAVASAAVILSTVVPATFASTNVSVNGNGAFSKNNVTVNNTSGTTITQSNSSTVITEVNSTANTGKNTSTFNTGGDNGISTGNATSNVNVTVGGSSNNATVNTTCGCNNNTTVNVKNNGAFSSNGVKVTNNSSTNVLQQAWNYIVTGVASSANTGDNSSVFNTKGTNGIVTGNSHSNVTVNVTGSSNTLQ